MQDIEYTPILIRTKLNRPPLPMCMVKWPRLTGWLSDRLERPLTLVTAPDGYGKSTLISCWLEVVDRPATWVSLDAHDNELGSFLAYFLAAIQTIYPQIEIDGWYLVATKGSHRPFKHPNKPGHVTIAGHPSDDLAPGTLNSILKQPKICMKR